MKYQMLAAVNAGMFQENGLTSVGFMKNFGHVNNPRLSNANTILAFNPVGENLPEIQIIDRECQDFNDLRQKYQSFVQSIRMISCSQQNVWSRQDSKWSTLAVGMDTQGNILFLFSRTPLSVHDFIEILLSLPLSLKSAMYLEGGPQASLYLSTSRMTLERYGVWGGLEKNSLQFPLPVPNVIGISKKHARQKLIIRGFCPFLCCTRKINSLVWSIIRFIASESLAVSAPADCSRSYFSLICLSLSLIEIASWGVIAFAATS